MLGRRALKLLAGSPLPANWWYPSPPKESERVAREGPLSIEIVSHCWGYSRLLAYQLTSLIDHPISDARVRMTVFHGKEDTATVNLLAFIKEHRINNLEWNWRVLPPQQLFRRSIGRNLAALESSADWLWFTDCDMTFQTDCLDSLNAVLQGRRDALVYPQTESKTDAYAQEDAEQPNVLKTPELLRVAPEDFIEHQVTRATGPLQITHGDVARSVGYCNAVPYYQQPQARWQKADEDRMFRWLLGTQGVPVEVDGVCRVQHVQKGRYAEHGPVTSLRRQVRAWQDSWRRFGNT